MKKIKYVLFSIVICFCMVIMQNVYAASSSLSGSTSIKNGTTFTVNISVNTAAAWNVKVSYDNSKLEYVSGDLSIADSKTGKNYTGNIGSVTFKARADGNANINLTGQLTDENKNKSNANGSLNVNVYTPATPPVDNNSGSSGGGNSGNNSGGSTNGGNTATKSSNANLKSLKLNHEGLSPAFNASKTNYSLAVGPEISSINVTAVAQDSKAKVSVSGNTNLKDGDNIIYIVVTAENGGKKTYSITVTKTADANKSNAYLESMIVENATLSPAFEREVLEYDCGTVGSDIDRLTILAFPENKEAKFEITGNELIEGENIVRVKVIAVDGTTTKEYVIKVLKEKEEVTSNPYVNIYEDGDNNNLTNKNTLSNIWETIKDNSLLLIMYLLVIVEFIQIVYLYRKLYGKNNEHKNVGVMTKEDLVKSKIGEVKEGVGIEKTLDNTEPRKRNALNQFNVKDLTEEKKELEDTNTKSKDNEEKND